MSNQPKRFIGKYEILGEIGKGSMGTVYKARDPVLDRVVALKTILPSAEIHAESRERFLREARSVARLQHTNIITIFEMGEVEGVPFIAMEFLEGESLAEALRRGHLGDLRDKLDLIHQLCRGLGYAHQRGVVHRDIKPSNIFLLEDGTTKVLDFGVAWLEGGTFATRTGMLLGTPAYMAPEQFSGEPVDHRVDQWAVGVILYELLSGKRPFDAETVPSLIYQIVHTPLPDIDPARLGIPVVVVQLIKRALQKDPDDRYPNLEVMGSAVQAILTGEAAAAEVDPTATRQLDRSKGRPASVRPSTPSGSSAPTVVERVPRPETAVVRYHPGTFRDVGALAQAGPLQVIAASPDEQLLAVGGVDGAVRIWHLESRASLHTLRSRVHLRTGHAALTTSLAFTADGTLLAAGHLDGSIFVWDPVTGRELEAQLRHEGAVGGVAFIHDGETLVSGGRDATVKYWEVAAIAAGDAKRQMRRQPAEVTTLTVTAREDLLVTGHGNLNLRGHDPESGRLVATFHGLRAVSSALAFSPDGSLLACGGRDGSIRLFRVSGRAQLRHYEAHSKTVSSLAFFPDGRHMVSVAMDKEIAIWEVSHDDRLATLSVGAGDSCASVAVLGRSGLLVCGLAGGAIRVWQFG
jgi:serine/threonine protein kinase